MLVAALPVSFSEIMVSPFVLVPGLGSNAGSLALGLTLLLELVLALVLVLVMVLSPAPYSDALSALPQYIQLKWSKHAPT